MERLDKAIDYLEMALGGNMNTKTLTPLAISEIMEDYHKNKLKLLDIDNVSKSLCTCNYAGTRGEKQCNHCLEQMEEGEF